MSEQIHYTGCPYLHYTGCPNRLILYTGVQTYNLYRVSELRYCLGWEFARWFSEQIARFFQKNERKSYLLKKTRDSLIFGNWPERFAHSSSFVMSDLSDSHTSLFNTLAPGKFFVLDFDENWWMCQGWCHEKSFYKNFWKTNFSKFFFRIYTTSLFINKL